MFFGKEVSGIVFPWNVQDTDFVVEDTFTHKVLSNIAMSHVFAGHRSRPIDCPSIVIEQYGWRWRKKVEFIEDVAKPQNVFSAFINYFDLSIAGAEASAFFFVAPP